MQGHLAFQDYAVAKWFHHVNAFIDHGKELVSEGVGVLSRLEEMSTALDDFISKYEDEDWYECDVTDCKEKCKIFEDKNFYPQLVAVASHIYTFQKKGFDARHTVNVKSLATALERNRNLLEELPKTISNTELVTYRQFYDDARRYKCTKITCVYFWDGFKDPKSRKRHVALHERPYQCEASDCLAAEYGFSNSRDLEKYTTPQY